MVGDSRALVQVGGVPLATECQVRTHLLSMPANQAISQNELIASPEPIDYDGGMPDTAHLTLRDLLRDPVYKKWFLKIPDLPDDPATSPLWYLYLLDDGKWKRANARTYKGALKFASKNIKNYEDIVIHSKRHPFRPIRLRRHYNPPVYRKYKTSSGKVKKREVLEVVEWDNFPHDHMWCPFCRRPTRFKKYSVHHAFPANFAKALTDYTRCEVCGLRSVEALRINERKNHGAH